MQGARVTQLARVLIADPGPLSAHKQSLELLIRVTDFFKHSSHNTTAAASFEFFRVEVETLQTQQWRKRFQRTIMVKFLFSFFFCSLRFRRLCVSLPFNILSDTFSWIGVGIFRKIFTHLIEAKRFRYTGLSLHEKHFIIAAYISPLIDAQEPPPD
jgi:hypothetical protein